VANAATRNRSAGGLPIEQVTPDEAMHGPQGDLEHGRAFRVQGVVSLADVIHVRILFE
jgi:hypothetical protein